MRIAILTETFLPKIDGITNTLCYLLDYLAQQDHECLLLAPEGGPDWYAKTRVIGLRALPFLMYPELKLAPPGTNVSAHLAEFHPDLVHVVNPVSLGVAGLLQARRLGLPVVASYQTDIPGFAARWGFGVLSEPLWSYLRWIHNQANLTLCPSRITQLELAARGFERLAIWSRGVDKQRFHPQRRSEEWRQRLSGGDTQAPLLLFVGRLAREKRIDWLRMVLDKLPGTHLAIVGDGPVRPELEHLFAGAPVTFTGYLGGLDLAHAYASADAFVFPSANETFGNVVLEAMASGLPVIAARSGGPLDFVQHGETGLLFEPEDQRALVSAVRRVLSDHALAHQLGAAARAHAESRSWAAQFEGLLHAYQAVIDEAAMKRAA
jgi:glycosyltransferase involved in cell wall biosynthesis